MKFKSILFMILLLAIGLSACQTTADCEPQVIVVTSVVEVVVTATPGEHAAPQATAVPTDTDDIEPAVEVSGDWIQPEDAIDHVGEVLAVRLDQAHCSYQANTNGTPTFCNDQAYPDHNFTFVAWGHDWSHYDGTCVIVEGEIEVYGGKAQIVVEDAGQVMGCP